ncbi:protein of unknown function [Ectopseudomonas oleovorans]|nr:protein of unknown function [Pseudomonas oleovorans]
MFGASCRDIKGRSRYFVNLSAWSGWCCQSKNDANSRVWQYPFQINRIDVVSGGVRGFSLHRFLTEKTKMAITWCATVWRTLWCVGRDVLD